VGCDGTSLLQFRVSGVGEWHKHGHENEPFFLVLWGWCLSTWAIQIPNALSFGGSLKL
jgi:hypothetical protein